MKQYERYEKRKNEIEVDFDVVWFLKIEISDKKIFVNGLNTYEIRNGVIRRYIGEFATIGDFIIGEHKRTTAMRI